MVTPIVESGSGPSRRALGSSRYVRVRRSIYVPADTPLTLAVRIDAVQAAIPDAVVSHHSAARLWGFPVDDDGLVHVSRESCRSACSQPGVRTHRGRLPSGDVTVLRGRRITTPARLLLDLARQLPRIEAVVLADAVVRRVGAGPVERRLAAAQGCREVRAARAALALADPGADSPAETRARLLLHAAGFPGLRHRLDVADPAGGWLARPDLADPAARVAIQYDGLVHLTGDPERRRSDIDRDELLRQHGWQVVVLTAIDLRHPDRMVAKVAAAYERAAR